MKIGLLTYHCVPNFGAQLQAVSTIGFLKKKKHTVYLIHWYAEDLEKMYSNRIPSVQIECHNIFTKENLPITNKVQTIENLITLIDSLSLDSLLVGSDALFKYIPLRKRRYFSMREFKFKPLFSPLSCELLDNNPFFGEFIGRLKKKIPASVYAVSSQNCPFSLLTKSERKQLSCSLGHFRMISVRDSWTQDMVKYVTGDSRVPLYPDPVFAFNTNCFIPIPSKQQILSKYNLPENYILLSFSNKYCEEEYILSIAKEAQRNNLCPVSLPMPELLFPTGLEKKIELPLDPLSWYSLIKYSKGYIGERMHPIVVCLHNAVPFYSFDEYGISEKKYFFSRKETYNPLSSKTYQIVTESGFNKNIFSYKCGKKRPMSEYIINNIRYFDIKKCQIFAQKKEAEYNSGMIEIIKNLE